MFSEASVCSWGGGRAEPPVWRQIPLSGGRPSSRQNPLEDFPQLLVSGGSHCSGGYTSYWNAFLFYQFLLSKYLILNYIFELNEMYMCKVCVVCMCVSVFGCLSV